MPFPNLDGRPSKYKEDVPNKLKDYIEWCKENQSLPKRAGFALFIGISKSTLQEWEKEHEQLSVALKELDTFQEEQLVDGSLFNKMNSTIAKLLLSNHGYSEKSEVKNEVDVRGVDFIKDN